MHQEPLWQPCLDQLLIVKRKNLIQIEVSNINLHLQIILKGGSKHQPHPSKRVQVGVKAEIYRQNSNTLKQTLQVNCLKM